eukprot:Skav213808  [mRNA]  locus=scaffold1987:441960:442616:- [translate_table: standard]
MDRLCANIAYSRRAARKLQMHDIADQLSAVLFALKMMQEKSAREELKMDAVVADHTICQTEDAVPSPAQEGTKCDTKNRKTRFGRDASSTSGALPAPFCKVSAAPFCKVSETVSVVVDSSGAMTPESQMNFSQELHSPEYRQDRLRAEIQQILQKGTSRSERVEALQMHCQKTLTQLCESTSLHLMIQVFRARLHLAFLEELAELEVNEPVPITMSNS